jgi:AraC-like DNA-binding protein
VRWRHAEPPSPEVQRAFFAAPVRFGAARDELVLPVEATEAPLLARDPGLSGVLGRVLEQMCAGLEKKDLLRDVKSCIGGMLSRGAPSVDDIARALSTSGRTLQRRLRENHTTFSELVASFQHELSLAYLRDPSLSVGEVAYLVGFADTTSFHRAFRRWTGDTPAGVRRQRVEIR